MDLHMDITYLHTLMVILHTRYCCSRLLTPLPTHTHNSYWLHPHINGMTHPPFFATKFSHLKTGLAPVHYIMNSCYSEIDNMPDEDQLQDVLTINDSDPRPTQQTPVRAPLSIDKDDNNVLVGTSYPPVVPNKLVKGSGMVSSLKWLISSQKD